MKIINLFGGPCTGKSTKAAELFSFLKKNGHNVELLTEYAKDLTWENNINKLNDQLFVLSTQYHKLTTLLNSDLDYIITDSPFILSLFYYKPTYANLIPRADFIDLAMKLYNAIEAQGHKNINIFIEKDENNYTLSGRRSDSSIEDLKNINNKIKSVLYELVDEYHICKNTDSIDKYIKYIL